MLFLRKVSVRPVVLFASRRGHTRCSRDWSSDVCSSDLVVKIVETESRTAADLNGEVAASHAEIIALQGIHMEGGATLAQNQARDESAVFQREIIKLENGVFLQEGQRAVFELDFRAAIVRRENVALANGQVHLSRIPASTGIRQRITLRFGRKAYVPGDHAEPDDAGMARVSRSRRHTKEQRRQQNQKQKGKQSTESHKSPPRGEQSLDGRGGGPVAPGTLPNKDSLAGSGRRQVALRPHADSRG